MKTIAIILSSGTGSRSGLEIPKQFLEIEGKTLLERSIEAFENHEQVDEIVLVSHKDYLEKTQSLVCKNAYKKVFKILGAVFAFFNTAAVAIHIKQFKLFLFQFKKILCFKQ